MAKGKSTRQLRAEIRELTKEINVNILDYQKAVEAGTVKESRLARKAIEILQYSAGVKARGDGMVGLGLENKRKGELEVQLAALQRFKKNDVFTPEGQRGFKRTRTKAKHTLEQNIGIKMTDAEYEQWTAMAGIIHQALGGAESERRFFAKIYAMCNKEGKKKMGDIIRDVMHSSKGKGMTDKQIHQEIWNRMGQYFDKEQ